MAANAFLLLYPSNAFFFYKGQTAFYHRVDFQWRRRLRGDREKHSRKYCR